MGYAWLNSWIAKLGSADVPFGREVAMSTLGKKGSMHLAGMENDSGISTPVSTVPVYTFLFLNGGQFIFVWSSLCVLIPVPSLA